MTWTPSIGWDWRKWWFGLWMDQGEFAVRLGPLSLNLDSTDRRSGWTVCWWLLRVMAGTVEVRLELDLTHALMVGFGWSREMDDFSVFAGPLDIEIDKFHDAPVDGSCVAAVVTGCSRFCAEV